jgi:RimJ/RimL family protein N-acetyltransferase
VRNQVQLIAYADRLGGSLAGLGARVDGVQVVVRAAVPADAAAVGHVHVLAWQAAYVGLMPQAYLDGLDADQRAGYWRQVLSRSREQAPVLVGETGGEVAGFATFGPAQDDPGTSDGELYAINVRPDRWGSGMGGALLAAAHAGLAGLGYRSAVLWVLPGNQRARAVYEHLGWRLDGVERTVEIRGFTVPEVRYRRPLP